MTALRTIIAVSQSARPMLRGSIKVRSDERHALLRSMRLLLVSIVRSSNTDNMTLRTATPAMHTHPPIDPDDPSGTSGEDVREPPLPGTQGTPREEFPRKGDLVDPEPAATNK